MDKRYTKREFLFAAQIGEVSMIDANHIVSLLDEASEILKKTFDCRMCAHSKYNELDNIICDKLYLLPIDNCGGSKFEKSDRFEE